MSVDTSLLPEAFNGPELPLPLDDFSSRGFEVFVCDLLNAEIAAGLHDGAFNKARLLEEGADEGRDIILYRGETPVGVVQCKRYKGNVGHDITLDEIIKFLLFARLHPDLLPDPADFLYVLAVSNDVTGNNRKLFDEKSRLIAKAQAPIAEPDDLVEALADLETRVIRVKAKYSSFKDIDVTAAFPDIVASMTVMAWGYTNRGNLSARARIQPSVMRRHFRSGGLDASAVEVITGVIKETITPLLTAHAPISPGGAPGLFEVAFADLKVLKNGCRLPLCLVQPDPPTEKAIAGDQSRKSPVETIRDLLATSAGKPATLHDLSGPVAFVLLPELTFGSEDWQEIDALVRGWNRNLVLIAGFGATRGQWLLDWIRERGETTRKLAINGESDIAPSDTYNGGWCWIHRASSQTTCAAFLKNFLTAAERGIVTGMGETSLMIRFSDLLVFPTICADLISDEAAPPRNRIIAAVNAAPAGVKVLVTGSLLQNAPWDYEWQRALNRVTDGCGARRDAVIVALANHAFHKPLPDEEKDRWRSLSGIYTAPANQPRWGAKPEVATRKIKSDLIAGVALRRSQPSVVFGSVEWPPYDTTTSGKFLWNNGQWRHIGPDGPITEPIPPVHGREPTGHELARFLVRNKPKGTVSQRLIGGLQKLRACLECEDCFKAELLAGSCLHGIVPPSSSLDPDDHFPRPDVAKKLERTLHAFAYLAARSDRVEWQQRGDPHGQLHWPDQKLNLLLWETDGTRRVFERLLDKWMEETSDHLPLMVIAKTSGKPVLPGIFVSDRRANFSTPPSNPKDFDGPSQGRVIYTFPLDNVIEAYSDDDPAAEDELWRAMEDAIEPRIGTTS